MARSFAFAWSCVSNAPASADGSDAKTHDFSDLSLAGELKGLVAENCSARRNKVAIAVAAIARCNYLAVYWQAKRLFIVGS